MKYSTQSLPLFSIDTETLNGVCLHDKHLGGRMRGGTMEETFHVLVLEGDLSHKLT